MAQNDAKAKLRRGFYADFRRASNKCEADPQSSISIMESAAARAHLHGEAWWEMFLRHWQLQFMLNKASQPARALPLAARCALEARKPLYAGLPQRVCLHEDLINAYTQIDPVGNAALIGDALDYMDQEIAPGVECRMCFAGLRAEWMRLNDDANALDAAHDYLALAQRANQEFHGAQALIELCRGLWHFAPEEAPQTLEELAQAALECAREGGYDEGVHEISMWQALAAQLDGDARAVRRYQLALEARGRYGGPASGGYYQAAVAYQRECGDWTSALELCDVELGEIVGTGQVFREVSRRLEKCSLLRQSGADASKEIGRVRAVARELKARDWVEAALESLG